MATRLHATAGAIHKACEVLEKNKTVLCGIVIGLTTEPRTDQVQCVTALHGPVEEHAIGLASVLRDMAKQLDTQVPIDLEGQASSRLETELKRIVQDTGEVVLATMYEPAKGGGWATVLSTEHAALRVFYQYRDSDVHLVHNDKGWVITVRPI